MSNRVIVEGSVLHNPLNEGSILWVTDTRLALGLVDEIFGPVKNPYYVVRYNTEEDVPAGIGVGIAVSFVSEFATQILNNKELCKKGYDASGDNDEEVDNETEFSDDEKEAEHKKSLRVGKRVINQCKGLKQESRFESKRNSFMGPRAQHNDIQKQVTCGQLSIDQQHPTGLVQSQLAPLMNQSGVKQDARFERKRNSFMGPKAAHRDIQKQVTCAQSSINQQHPTGPVPSQPAPLMDQSVVKQDARFERKRNSFMGPMAPHWDIQKQVTCAQLSIDQQHPTGLMPSQSAPLMNQSGIGPGSWSSSLAVTNADSLPPPTLPPTLQQFPQAVQAVNYLGNPSQQLLTQHQNSPWQPGFLPQLQNTGLQSDIPMQLQNQNVVLNNLVNMMAFQQLLQQFVPHQGSSLPWVGAALSLQPLGQNNFASSPFSNGFINVPGTPGLGNEQIQGQTPLPLPPTMQFNAGSSTLHSNGGHSWPRGRRPYQRGGGRFFDRGGRQPNR